MKIRQALKIGEKTFKCGTLYRHRTSNAALKRMTRWQRKWRKRRNMPANNIERAWAVFNLDVFLGPLMNYGY